MEIEFDHFCLKTPPLTEENIIGEGNDGTIYRLKDYTVESLGDNIIPKNSIPLVLKQFHISLSSMLLPVDGIGDALPMLYHLIPQYYSKEIFEILKGLQIPTYAFFEVSQQKEYAVMPFIENVYSAQDFDVEGKIPKRLSTEISLESTYKKGFEYMQRMTDVGLIFAKHAEFVKITESQGALKDIEILIGDLANVRKANGQQTVDLQSNLKQFFFSFLHTYRCIVDDDALIRAIRELLDTDWEQQNRHLQHVKVVIREIVSSFFDELLNQKVHETPQEYWNLMSHGMTLLQKTTLSNPKIEKAIGELEEVVQPILASWHGFMRKNYAYQLNTVLYDSVWFKNNVINKTCFRDHMEMLFEKNQEVMQRLDQLLTILKSPKTKKLR